MGILGNLAHKFTDDFVGGFKKYATKDVMEGTMAALAWIAWANKELKEEEKKKILGFIQRDEALKAFKERQLLECFEHFSGTFEFSYDMGVEKSRNAIKKITNEEASRILVTGVIAIGKADGDFDKDERAVAKEICNILSLQPKSFGL